MGQKINPIGYRLAIRRNWSSMWYARGTKFKEQVLADSEVRTFIRKRFGQAMISRIEIKRHPGVVRAIIHTARPGMVIGKKGEDIEKLRGELKAVFGSDNDIRLDIEEIRQPEADAQLIAMNISSQLEKRVAFRRAVRRAVSSALRLGVQGIKIICSGRLNGAEIARTERYSEGRVPLHTLRADIDYGFSAAHTTMGTVGVKVWIFKGEVYQRTRKQRTAGEMVDFDDLASTDSAAGLPVPEDAGKDDKAIPAKAKVSGLDAGEKAEEGVKRKSAAGKPAAKKAVAKKPAAKKVAAKKPVVKKAVAKKAVAKKPADHKTEAKE